jgi:hypothetical protein
MLPNPEEDRTLYIAVVFVCTALYVVLTWFLWSYAICGVGHCLDNTTYVGPPYTAYNEPKN